MEAKKLLLSQRDVALLLSVSESTVANLRRRGALPYVKFGKSLRFRPADVSALADSFPARVASREAAR